MFFLQLFFVFLLSIQFIHPLYLNFNTQSSSQHISLGEKFGMNKNGIVHAKITAEQDTIPLELLLMSSNNTETLSKYDPETYTYYPYYLCRFPASARYQFLGSLDTQMTIDMVDKYEFLVVNCDQNIISVKGYFHFLNPDHKELPYGQIYFPIIYLIFFIFYVMGFTFWIVLMTRNKKKTFGLQTFLTITLASKVLSNLLSFILYQVRASNGQKNDGLMITLYLAEILSETLLISTLLLISVGSTILTPRITKKEFWKFFAVILLFFIFDCVRMNCIRENESDPDEKCSAYRLAFYALEFLIAFAVIVAINANLERLRTQVFDPRWTRPQQYEKYYKLKMFKKIRWFFFVYLVGPILLLFIQYGILSWVYSWLSLILNEIFDVLVFCILHYYCRPTQDNLALYYPIQNQNQNENQNENQNQNQNENQNENQNQNEDENQNVIQFESGIESESKSESENENLIFQLMQANLLNNRMRSQKIPNISWRFLSPDEEKKWREEHPDFKY